MTGRRSAGLLLMAAALFACSDSAPDATRKDRSDTTVFASNGARIYYTATSQSGSPVLTSAAFGDKPGPAAKSCSDCHGPDGGGGMFPTDSGWLEVPPISWRRLTTPGTYIGGRAYDEASLALTLRTGVRVDGYLLSSAMPRWTLSSEDMQDLLAHLKTLGAPATGR